MRYVTPPHGQPRRFPEDVVWACRHCGGGVMLDGEDPYRCAIDPMVGHYLLLWHCDCGGYNSDRGNVPDEVWATIDPARGWTRDEEYDMWRKGYGEAHDTPVLGHGRAVPAVGHLGHLALVPRTGG